MLNTQPLEIMNFPLHGTRLIEASAGTGKTYTVAALYVRLVLGHGNDNAFARPLTPPEILVMTFTDAATKELRDRIRARLAESARLLTNEISAGGDAFLEELDQAYTEPNARVEAAQRLISAAYWMDEAAIFTIHGFCHRLLRQHAFESGSLFDLTLTPSASDDEYQAACDYWRTYIAPLSRLAAQGLHSTKVNSPKALLERAEPAMGKTQAPTDKTLTQTLAVYEENVSDYAALEQKARDAVTNELAQIKEWFEAALTKKWIHGNTYKATNLPEKFSQLEAFARGASCLQNKELGKLLNDFASPGIKFNKKHISQDPQFQASVLLAQVVEAFEKITSFPIETLLTHAAHWITERVEILRQQNATISFNDMILRMQVALTQGEQGKVLAKAIRQQYPVAMLDEFQDTDPLQYRIFSEIYHAPELSAESYGWFMVGDPKQAIYAFRDADIYTYLEAGAQAQGKYTLSRNFRSAEKMVAATNDLFQLGNAQNPEQGVFFNHQIPFTPVEAQGRKERFVVESQEISGLYSWQAEEYEKSLSSGRYREEQAHQTANAIANLLNLAESNQAGFQEGDEFRALRPRDIAVLVRSGNEARVLRQALSKKKVASVYYSEKDSVFDTQEAKDLLLILNACAHPEDSRKVRSALACQSLCQSISELAALFVDDDEASARFEQEQQWDLTLERFQNYRELWQRRSVLVMLHALLHDYQVPVRLAQQQNERALVNLRHLAELAQQAAAQLDGEQALLRWLKDAIAEVDNSDDSLLRLESDADRVKVITIHKSKGLEFPLVFLPFICAYREIKKDEAGRYLVNGQLEFALTLTEENLALADEERLAEDMRLLYVAITRAQHACWLGLTPMAQGQNKENQLQKGAMGRLLFGQQGVSNAEFLPTLQELNQPHFTLTPLPTEAEPYAPNADNKQLQAPLTSCFAPESPNWWIGNYSALKTARAYVPTQASSLDDEEHDLVEVPVELAGIHAFPRGPEPGNFLHKLFEVAADAGFAQTLTELTQYPAARQERLQRWLQNHGWEAHAETLLAQWARWLSTPLKLEQGTEVPLSDITTQLAEMEFWFPSQQITSATLDALLCEYLMPTYPLGGERPPFLENQLYGMFKGYIDLVFEHEGRYYVLDYKSNWLGPDASAYTHSAMEAAVLKHRYEAQYTFYLLALHKLLKARLGESYDPQQHLGGVVYLFLRGTDNPDTHGCYFQRPEQALIDKLDTLFTHAPMAGDTDVA